MNYGKEIYDQIEIPEELSARVEAAIQMAEKKKGRGGSQKLVAFIRTMGVLAATFLICLTVGVNSSQVLASELWNIPVFGALAQVLTIRNYEIQEGNVNLVAQVPEIQETIPAGQGGSDYVAEVNAEINRVVDTFIEKARTDMEDYKEAFFATGGTEEEWADRKMDVNVSYEVKYQEGPYLSMVLYAEEGWVTAYRENGYYNLNLETQKDITLEDLLGSDYIRICNESITEQINEQLQADEGAAYFGYGADAGEVSAEDKFHTVTPETNFYINEQGNPVICFAKYEIAPGFMGVCEFEILRNY